MGADRDGHRADREPADGAPADEALVDAAMTGDADAFSALYRRHVAAVHRTVAATLRDRDAVADITQDVFVRVVERLPTLREPERFRAWVLSIARHAAIDYTRDRRPVTGYDGDEYGSVREPDPTPEELAELAELVERVRACVAGLSARDATALSLVTRLGYAPAEVGRVLGVSPGAAKVVLHRARVRLRNALALTLLAENQTSACEAFRAAYEQGRLSLAGAHVPSCPRCIAAVNTDVHLYSAVAVDHSRDPRPTTRMPDRSSVSASASGNGGSSAIPKPVTSVAP